MNSSGGNEIQMRTNYSLYILVTIGIIMSCSNKDENSTKVEKVQLNPDKVVGIGRIEPEGKMVNLYSEVVGVVEKLNVDAGSHIKEGEIILSLTNSIQYAALQQAKTRVKTQIDQIGASKAAFEAQRLQADNSQREYVRNKNMYEKGAITKQAFESVQTNYLVLNKNVEQAKVNIEAAEKRLNEIYSDINVAQAQYDQRFIKAPANGTVLSLEVTIGTEVNPSVSFGEFAPDGNIIAVCEIDELFASKVRLGQDAYVRPQGSNDTLAWGKVTFASPALKKKSLFSDQVGDLEDRRVREVRITLIPNESLLYGSRIECVILLSSKH